MQVMLDLPGDVVRYLGNDAAMVSRAAHTAFCRGGCTGTGSSFTPHRNPEITIEKASVTAAASIIL
jgi:hypothetical protein